ncbi:MAG TPA: methylmalonyl-CoA mutase, partial [Hyphomonas sp.]|nr:methylmalonyl-CoA mutase [Hyphomonas sp.]
ANTQARIDSGTQTVVGVNKFLLDEEEDVPVLKVDNAAVRRMQLDKLARLKSERDEAEVTAKLDAIAKAAAGTEGNLLALAVDAARA